MLTTKNSAAKALSTILTTLLVVLFTGCQPSGPKSLLLGDKYVRQGDYPKALKYLARAAIFMPELPQVWNLQGLAYHGLQQPARAAESYQRALRIDRNFAPAHFNLGVLLLEQDRPSDAATELNAYVALEEQDDQGWSRLGAALVRLRKADEAERALNQAVKLNNKNADAHNSLGLVHIQRKRPREAMQAFNTALQCRTGFGAALLNQAIVAQQYFGNTQIALERYRAYLSTKPHPKAAAAVQLAMRQIEEGTVEPTPPVLLADLRTNTGISALLRSNLALQAERMRTPEKTNEAPAQPAPQIAATVKTNVAPVTQVALAPKTNVPPPVATNQIAHTPSPVTNPAPAVVVVPPKTNTPPPEVEPESETPLQVEVVAVNKEPELQAPKDLDSGKVQTSAETQLAMNKSSATNAEPPLTAPRKKPDEEKRGILGRLKQANPARWFDHEEPKTAPVPASRSSSVVSIPPVTETAPRVTPAVQRQPVARYNYRKDLPITRGNRTQAQRLFSEAAAAHQQYRFQEAIGLYRQAIHADGSFFDAHYNLGLAAYQNKDLPLALAANEQAVALKPTSTDARYNFALTLRDSRYFTDAANELRELLNEAPNEARAHLTLANIYAQHLEEPALARRHYQRFLEIAPNHQDAVAIRQWLVTAP